MLSMCKSSKISTELGIDHFSLVQIVSEHSYTLHNLASSLASQLCRVSENLRTIKILSPHPTFHLHSSFLCWWNHSKVML